MNNRFKAIHFCLNYFICIIFLSFAFSYSYKGQLWLDTNFIESSEDVSYFGYIAELSLKVNDNLLSAIIIPDKDIIPGSKTYKPAYLVYNNYEKILNWNRSLRFALAVCTLKESFKNEI